MSNYLELISPSIISNYCKLPCGKDRVYLGLLVAKEKEETAEPERGADYGYRVSPRDNHFYRDLPRL